jgi:hypothetical protein
MASFMGALLVEGPAQVKCAGGDARPMTGESLHAMLSPGYQETGITGQAMEIRHQGSAIKPGLALFGLMPAPDALSLQRKGGLRCRDFDRF